MTVTSATIRLATPEESAYARGGFFYQLVSKPTWSYLQKCGEKELLADKSNYFLHGKPPLVLRTWTVVKQVFGYGDNILTRYPCTGFDHVEINEKKQSKPFLITIKIAKFFFLTKA